LRPGKRRNCSWDSVGDTAKFYDTKVLRTIFLTFEQDDWEQELADFKPTDVEIPAEMIVDGKTYPNVGVSFRGASSFFMIPEGSKRSLNISMDYLDEKQNLYGYKSLNLLNGNGDPTMMSSVLYSTIASKRMATAKANFVTMVEIGASIQTHNSSIKRS
jgi:spore coat protein CotH